MSKNGTVEIHHKNILKRIKKLYELFEIIKSNNIQLDIITSGKLKRAKNTLDSLSENYEVDVVSSLISYYEGNSSASIMYQTQLLENNYIGKINECHNIMLIIIGKYVNNCESPILISLKKKYENIEMVADPEKINYKECPCGEAMEVFPVNSELICPKCGFIKILYGTVFEDTQFYNQEGQRTKHGSYDPSRHCRIWVSKIQARGSVDIPAKCIDLLVECVKRDGITDGRRVLCSQIRKYLKEIHYTIYNDYIPFIRKIITGVVPPQLTNSELRLLYNIFDKAMHIYDTIKPMFKHNGMYYPYIIYKILDHILDNNMRKRKILECIHLQSRETLISNDDTWSDICEEIDGIKYKPTDENDNLMMF
jgi:hypothetical protein